MSSELTKEEIERKGYAIGEITMDDDGIWHVAYIGWYKWRGVERFGPWSLSDRNVRRLLDTIGSRLGHKQDVYLGKIKELKNVPQQPEASSTGLGNGPDVGSAQREGVEI